MVSPATLLLPMLSEFVLTIRARNHSNSFSFPFLKIIFSFQKTTKLDPIHHQHTHTTGEKKKNLVRKKNRTGICLYRGPPLVLSCTSSTTLFGRVVAKRVDLPLACPKATLSPCFSFHHLAFSSSSCMRATHSIHNSSFVSLGCSRPPLLAPADLPEEF